jgi:tetratricopeptide (TPR) repeat protein
MCQLLLEEKDTAGGLSYIEKGRERFYDDRDLIIEQVNLSIKMGKSDELLKRMSEDIEYDAGNSTLYLVRGILYEKKGDQEAAKKDYLEALELNPGYFVAAFNLGAMCYDAGAEILTAAKDILDNAKYAKEKEKAMALFKEGIPHLEAALEIDPTDDAAAQRLVRMYARTGDTDKYNALKAKMEGM